MVKLLQILKSGVFLKVYKSYFLLLCHTLLENVLFVYLLEDLVKLRLIPSMDTLCPLQMHSRSKKKIKKKIIKKKLLFISIQINLQK